jgi:mRNA capping enzyme, beta chain
MKPMEKFVPFGPKLNAKGDDEKMPKQPQSGKKELEKLQIQTQRLTSASETPETNGHAQPQSSRPWEVPTMSDMELSLDAVVPYSDLTRTVANFLYENVVRAPDINVGHLEVEAKLGTIYTSDDHRISVPVITECVVQDGVTRRFESKMTMEQHKALNNYLNTETTRSHGTKGRIPIKYEHLRQVDSFYNCPQFFLDSLPDPVKQVLQRSRHSPRVRVTRDAKSGEVLATIVKIRIKNMEIHCPQEHFDYRISASLELDYPHAIEGLVDTNGRGDRTSRTKDRLSYQHQCMSIDLTQVTPENGGEKTHELELELDEKTLKEQGMLASEGAPNNYEALVGVFLNYVRAVNRACKV